MKTSFEVGTTEAHWSPTDDAHDSKYVLRFIHAETCCESPYANIADWPVICFSAKWSPEDESDYDYKLSVVAGLWLKESGKFIGFWGADEGDGHVDFYCRDDSENIEDLDIISGVLCTKICPELIDVFDDGSGSEREPRMIPVSVFTSSLLNNLYSQ
jgi:hypothetical protein